MPRHSRPRLTRSQSVTRLPSTYARRPQRPPPLDRWAYALRDAQTANECAMVERTARAAMAQRPAWAMSVAVQGVLDALIVKRLSLSPNCSAALLRDAVGRWVARWEGQTWASLVAVIQGLRVPAVDESDVDSGDESGADSASDAGGDLDLDGALGIDFDDDDAQVGGGAAAPAQAESPAAFSPADYMAMLAAREYGSDNESDADDESDTEAGGGGISGLASGGAMASPKKGGYDPGYDDAMNDRQRLEHLGTKVSGYERHRRLRDVAIGAHETFVTPQSKDDALPLAQRRRAKVVQGQGARARLDQVVLESTDFLTCSPVVAYNAQTGVGGLFHYSSSNWADQSVALTAWLDAIDPTEIAIYGGITGDALDAHGARFIETETRVKSMLELRGALRAYIGQANITLSVYVNAQASAVSVTLKGATLLVAPHRIAAGQQVDLSDAGARNGNDEYDGHGIRSYTGAEGAGPG